jgi:hypothetical protein
VSILRLVSERERRKTIRLRRGPFLMVSLGLIALVGIAGAVVSRGGDEQGAGAVNAPGCVLTTSEYGYPDWYLTESVEFTAHPPLPVVGWRDSSERVRFNALFHSIFHGYVVVEYRPDLAPEKLASLKAWVSAHAGDRVTSAAASADAPFAVDVAKWGHELRCTSAAALTTQRLERFLALPRSSG